MDGASFHDYARRVLTHRSTSTPSAQTAAPISTQVGRQTLAYPHPKTGAKTRCDSAKTPHAASAQFPAGRNARPGAKNPSGTHTSDHTPPQTNPCNGASHDTLAKQNATHGATNTGIASETKTYKRQPCEVCASNNQPSMAVAAALSKNELAAREEGSATIRIPIVDKII